ncbi:hypothetical protein D7B24_008350 [Verticillium nonalfalfae]|uniref:Zn(2)-C6 fungal-type domain-containing protein n=1 Tax=Verticillium nonalfalfae TaxID=1051616 RepID=A0A3M9Y5T6_9PEZI|nr:uncharacterized protein D7B24_008350 [Verticillium nonalfalfae]RNJ55641.1 hypothetical protein D7B24_008350 [Verticillium nonalfalfae]
MAPPKTRVRKFHRRSKNGCIVCKERHVRCDERQPLCTNCLQNGTQCRYPPTAQAKRKTTPPDAVLVRPTVTPSPTSLLSTSHAFAGFGKDYQLSNKSKWLFHHWLLHGSLVVAACQWAWVTGSLDHVMVPFLHHKAAAYEFARQQVLDPEQAFTETTVFAIATLALAEGAIGDLDASSKHLRGLHELTLRKNGYSLAKLNTAQQMLEMAGDRLRRGEVGILHDAIGADFQPTVIALLFTSLWDLGSLPPREAPRYGWWEASETKSDRLWQGYTKNLNWELSRGFDPQHNITMMLNSDPKSSRASYIATFFYVLMAVNDSRVDCVLTVWLLEQLIDDICLKEEDMLAGTFSRHLWLWSVLFGAAVASAGLATESEGQRQLDMWRAVYADKIRLVSRLLNLRDWKDTKQSLAEVAWTEGTMAERKLREIWEDAVGRENLPEMLEMQKLLELTSLGSAEA